MDTLYVYKKNHSIPLLAFIGFKSTIKVFSTLKQESKEFILKKNSSDSFGETKKVDTVIRLSDPNSIVHTVQTHIAPVNKQSTVVHIPSVSENKRESNDSTLLELTSLKKSFEEVECLNIIVEDVNENTISLAECL